MGIARQQPHDGGRAALVGHIGHFQTDFGQHQFGGQVKRMPKARGAVKILVGVFFREGKKLLQGVGLDLTVEHDDGRIAANERSGCQVGGRVIGGLGRKKLGNGDGRRRRKQQGVAIGCGAHHRLRANLARGTRYVFHRDGLAPLGTEQLGNQPPYRVRPATGWKRHHHADVFLGVFALR